MKVRWTEAAARRLEEIRAHVARDDDDASAQLAEALLRLGESLRTLAMRGRPVPELPELNLRELIHGNYRLVYRVRGRSVEILTVFEGHRLLRSDELK
jgi:toxin ParE1/3/4